MLNNDKIGKLTRDVIIKTMTCLMNFTIHINFKGHRDQFGMSELLQNRQNLNVSEAAYFDLSEE